RFHRRAGVAPDILLPHDAGLIDDEGHHAGLVVSRRPGDEAEAARCAAVGRRCGEAGQDLEVVAVEWLRRLTRAGPRGFVRGCFREQFAERASWFALRRRPVESVVLARIAAE